MDQNRLVLYIMSRQKKLGLLNGAGYFKRIKDLTDAWQTLHNENISLETCVETGLIIKILKIHTPTT